MLSMYIGPMFAGKSTMLIRKVQRYQIARLRCIVLKWAKDVRYDEESTNLSTHCGNTKLPCRRVSNKLMDHIDKVKDFDVIGLDDGQFFPDIEEFCEEVINKMQKRVIISALDSDFRRMPFRNITNLVAKAEKVKKLCAICTSCGRKGSYSAKIVDNSKEFDKDKNPIDIGGAEKYTVLCRQCYLIKDGN